VASQLVLTSGGGGKPWQHNVTPSPESVEGGGGGSDHCDQVLETVLEDPKLKNAEVQAAIDMLEEDPPPTINPENN